MKGFEELFIVAWMLFGILLTPLFFIGFDYWAGIRKAHQRNEKIRSDKMKRTVDKIARYYNALLALVVIDIMQITGIWYLDNYYNWHLPIFPAVTLLGALGVAFIEVKSIYEPANEKEHKQQEDIAKLVIEIAKHRTSPSDLAEAVVSYINQEKKEEQNESKQSIN